MEGLSDYALITIGGEVPLPILSHDLENGGHNVSSDVVEQEQHSITTTSDKSLAAAEDILVSKQDTMHNNDAFENKDFPVIPDYVVERTDKIDDIDLPVTAQLIRNADYELVEKLKTLPPIVHGSDSVKSANKGEDLEGGLKDVLTTSGVRPVFIENVVPSSEEVDFLPLLTSAGDAIVSHIKEADFLPVPGIITPVLEDKDVRLDKEIIDLFPSIIAPVLEDKDVSLHKETDFFPSLIAPVLENKNVSPPQKKDFLHLLDDDLFAKETAIAAGILGNEDGPPTQEKSFLSVLIPPTLKDNDVSLAKTPEVLPVTTPSLEEIDIPVAKTPEVVPPTAPAAEEILPANETDSLPFIITPPLEDKELKSSGVEKLSVVTPSFEEIPVIVKTEPQDIFITNENIENETQHLGKQSELKAADISLITDLEIDFNYCASCNLDFRADPNETPKKLKTFSSFNTVSGDVKTVSILEALLLIFDLRFVKCCTAFHREESLLQEISLCTQCAIMATQMYKLYTEFSELIHAESILSKLVNHENVLQNNAIAKAATAKASYETELNDESQDFSENLPNIRVRNPSEKQRKGVASIFESDNESEGESHEVVNGLESVRRSSLENKKRINIEKNRRISVCNDKPSQLSISPITITMSSRLVKPTHLRIKKEHGKVPIQPVKVTNTIVNTKFSQRPKRIFDVKQESFVQPSRKIARGNSMDNSVPSIVSVHSIANPSIVKDEAQPCSSSSLQRTLRPKRTSCKIVDYSKQLGEESDEVEDDNDKDAEIFSEDEFDDDPNDPEFSKKPKPKTNIMLSKCAKKSKTKLSPIEIKRMFDNERLLKELSLPNLFPLTCKICKKTFRDVVSLERHKKTHKTISSFPCFICGMVCWNQNVFLTHLGTHIPEKPFVCDCCNASFKIKGELDQHKLRHQELIIFTCQQCKECFPSLMLLNRHEAAIHMKETSYICPMCPAVQFERPEWSKHILTHAPFKCTKCELFFNPNELKVHVQKFHPTQPPQKIQLQPQQSHSIFSDLLRAASQRIHH